MPRHQSDTVFQRRAIFMDARLLDGVGDDVRANLHWLGRLYRLVAIGGPVASPTVEEGLIYEHVAGTDVVSCIREHSIEAYASWFIGGAPPFGFRKAFHCQSHGAVERSLRSIRRRETESRIIIDYELLGQRVAAFRRGGDRIVFTNGVFDLLHIGHLRLLENARRLGDRLIVGINSDDSTKKIKGSQRPIIPQFARAEILTRLRQVDCCCIFTETDPRKVLSIVRPDVLAKGSEYTVARVVGARFVMGYGGTVARLPLVDGWSTTSTIRGISRTNESSPR